MKVASQSRTRVFAWALFWLAALALLVQCGSLVSRGAKEQSDIGVFVRTARLLDQGMGGEVYERRDSVTGWPIAIPPAGTVFFQPFLRLGGLGVAIAWAVLNALLAALAIVALRAVLKSLGGSYSESFPWMGAVFLLLAGGSVQVGQFSLLFASLWVFALWFALRGCEWPAALCWAWPAAIKVYPALLFAAPVMAAGGKKQAWLRALAFVASLVVFFVALPFAFYGARAWEMEVSFVQNVVLESRGRLKWMQALGTTANQGLDAVMIRYLSTYPKFHNEFPWIPTAGWDLDIVRLLAHFVRGALLAVTAVFSWRLRRKSLAGVEGLLWQTALWSSALYLCLPETRARYAVYAALAFLPLLMAAQRRPGLYALALLWLLLLLGAMPNPLSAVGIGLAASVALWVENLRAVNGRGAGA